MISNNIGFSGILNSYNLPLKTNKNASLSFLSLKQNLSADTVSFSNIKSNQVAFSGLKDQTKLPELNHRLVERINHPIYGEIQHYEVYNPANDVPETKQQVYIIENHEFPQVGFGINVLTGSGNENHTNNGVSHFLEHLVFKGTENLKPGQIDLEMEDLGAMINAYTSLDNTCYYTIFPKDNFSKAVKIYSDMVTHPIIPQDELTKERSVVIQEIIRSNADALENAQSELTEKLLGPHPYKRTILGPEDIIKNIGREEILAYHKNFYAPSNRQVIVYGDVKPEEVLKEVKKNFNDLDVKPVIQEKKAQPAKTKFEVMQKELDGMEGNAYTLMGFRGPEATNIKDNAALDLINIILGDGDSSRLNSDLLEQQEKVLSVESGFQKYKDASIFTILTYQKEQNSKKIQKLLDSHLKNIIENGITEKELNKAKNNLKYSMVNNFEQPIDFFADLAANLAIKSIKDDVKAIEIIDSLTTKDLQEVAAKYLNPKTAKIYNVKPKATPQTKKTKNVSFAGKLAANETSVKLDNGIELIVKKKPGSLMTAMSVYLKGGESLDDKISESCLLSNMLMRGTRHLTAEELNEELDNNAININASQDADGLVLEASALDTQKSNMFNLVSEIMTNPRFLLANNEVKQDLKRQKELIKEDLSQPNDREVGYDELFTSIYGKNHIYNSINDKVVCENIDKICLKDLINSYKKQFNPSAMTISIVGDVDINEAKVTFNKLLAPLKDIEVKIPNIEKPEISKTTLKGVPEDFESRKDQVKIYKAWKAPGVKNEDYVALKMLNFMLSGGCSTRLYKEFRENREGLCYEVSSRLKTYKDDGLIIFSVATSPEKMDECLNLFNNEVTKLLTTDKVTESEFIRAKNQFKNDVLMYARSSEQVGNDLSEHRALDIKSIEEILEDVDKLSLKDIHNVAEKYFSKPNITTVQASSEVLKQHGLLEQAS